MAAHQCPRCELRYPDSNEVRWHLVEEHGLDPEALERQLSGRGSSVHRDIPDPTHQSRRDGPTP